MTHDQAPSASGLLDWLDAPRASLVGAPYAGMVALALRLVVLCAAHRTHPMAT